jgi:hypothetical protein
LRIQEPFRDSGSRSPAKFIDIQEYGQDGTVSESPPDCGEQKETHITASDEE